MAEPSEAITATTATVHTQPPTAATTASIASLPLELARDIARLLHPITLAALIRTSRSVRRVFRPADSEIQFAEEHLEARYPWLRTVVEHDACRPRRKDLGFMKRLSEAYDMDLFDEQKQEAYEQLGKEVPFRQLPLCYALAVIKMDNFGPDAFHAISEGSLAKKIRQTSRSQERVESVDESLMAWLERLLLVGIRKVELGFGTRLIRWKGDKYTCKEACERVLQFTAFVDSVEAARCITEMERTSFQTLPRGRPSGQNKENDLLPEIKCNQFDLETFFTATSIPRFAYEACTLGAVSVLRFLLDTYPTSFVDLADYRNESDETYLQRAFKNNRQDVFKLLLDYMKRPPYGGEPTPGQPAPMDGNRDLPFLAAATESYNNAMVKFLLELGADPNFFVEPESSSHPTDPQLKSNGLRLAPHSKLKQRFDKFNPALHVACDTNRLELIKLLVAYGADPLVRGIGGYTALMACQTTTAVSALLEAVECHRPHAMHDLLVARCSKNNTVLHCAIEDKQYYKLVRVLLKAIEKISGKDGGRALKKEFFTTTGSQKETALLKACWADDPIRTLVFDTMFGGTDPDTFNEMRKVLLVANNYGYTPVHAAAYNGSESMLCKMLDVMSAVDDGMFDTVMKMKGGEDGRNPLHWAVRCGHLSCVRLLLERGADPEAKDASNVTPLRIAERHLKFHVGQKKLIETIQNALQKGNSGDRLDE
ncbi:hypothetical protein HDU96_010090 [Phlyctochytrium bullatum]|nr:hypothetical protein HDU96_010090 [Phlyctochytrium bullatum]